MLKKFKSKFKAFMTGKSGFSLVELIVVIAIMAVMAAVLVPALLGYVETSRAQKDDSAMSEITSAMTLSLADQEIYDECLVAAVKNNYSCYCDGDVSTNTNNNKIFTKEPDLWLFNDNCRLLDETIYKPAGAMRGVTITFKPNGKAEYILKDGIINQIGNDSTKKGACAGMTLADTSFETTYNRLRSTIGDILKVSSQTYRNSDYTIFISMGTTGGNQATAQDAIQIYGQFNGTNLSEVATASNVSGETQDKNASIVDISIVDSTLSNNSWETIYNVVKAGRAQDVGWRVGDSKTLTINGETKNATLIGLNHDGQNTATFMIIEGIGKHRYNPTNESNPNGVNIGGWEASEMRAWLNNDIFNSMIDNKQYIKSVTKYTNNVGSWHNGVTATEDQLFLLSIKEAGLDWQLNHPDYYNEFAFMETINNEGAKYEYFNDHKYKMTQASWLRSIWPKNDGCIFFSVYDKLNHNWSTMTATIHPVFVIG